MTFNEERSCGWSTDLGWMSGGKLHFQTFDDAANFVDMHVRTKDDVNLIDSIYDVYFVSRRDPEREIEIKVAHYWFNGDTGRTIVWEKDGFSGESTFEEVMTDWNKIESA